ncbi:MAG TPA: transcription elongation factor GreB [Rhodocyclaceae bacterium]|nr:transcription elongation factor GreB [Rhodocyclaceae bacterium]
MNRHPATPSLDAEADDETPEASPPAGGGNYLTLSGYARLQAELEQLVRSERPALVQTVSWAAGNGDRSENGDYIYGKKRLREIDRRIRYLMKRLENAVVVDPARQENLDQVFFAATVGIRDEDGTTARYRIVGIDEADATAGCISWISPLAQALMRARVGDVVRLRSPAGVREIEILDVSYQ